MSDEKVKKKIDPDMLAGLIAKKAMVLTAQEGLRREGRDVNFSAADVEVRRQLAQNLRGEEVTKSGKED